MLSLLFLSSLVSLVITTECSMTTEEWTIAVTVYYDRSLQIFNHTDLSGFLELYTTDVHLLPYGEPSMIGTTGVAQKYTRKILDGAIEQSMYLTALTVRWHCGNMAVTEYIIHKILADGTKDVEKGMTLHRLVDGIPNIMSCAWNTNA